MVAVQQVRGGKACAPKGQKGEIMTDYISRADAIERFCEFGTSLERQGKTIITMVDAKYAFIETLESLPSADAEFADLPDIPRAYYERIVGNMAHEINMLKEQLESAEAEPQSEQYKKGFEDAKRAFLIEYARESENMRKRNAQLEVMLNAQKAISADAVSREVKEDDKFNTCNNHSNNADADYKPHIKGEWEHWGSPFSDESEVIDTIVCSVCGARFIEPKDEPKGEYNYCPSCGARMKGGEDE